MERKVLMVLTRDVGETPATGGEKIIGFVRSVFRSNGTVSELRLFNVLEKRTFTAFLAAAFAGTINLVRLRLVPLQCLLFSSKQESNKVLKAIADTKPDMVYFDTVRCLHAIRAARDKFPSLRLICDFQDLMSRRMRALSVRDAGISMGYLRKLVPAWVQHRLGGSLGRAVRRYEQVALTSIEREICRIADDIVLVSAAEGAELRNAIGAEYGNRVVAIPPVYVEHRPTCVADDISRFVFVGSDSLLQNRWSIEFLIECWARLRPATSMHFFGRMEQSYPAVPNVYFHGFVDSVSDVYQPGSVLLAPAFLAGGVKTKILEGLAYGCLAVGNKLSFEGIDIPENDLCMDDAEIESFIVHPERYLQKLKSALVRARAYCSARHGPAALEAQWVDLMSKETA